MKNVYIGIMLIGIMALSADSNNFMAWIIWETLWFVAVAYSAYKLEGTK